VRPVSLTIEGLTSFKTPQEVDLSHLGLFVITGPTGSGKSSILDAITFALYGNVARVNAHELRDLISHGSSHMRVCLDFAVDGRRYRVARRIGRNRHEATLERIQNGSSATEVEHGGVRAVNDRLEEIVGLDFKAFTKAVLLPQGAFQEFLAGEVGERRRILMRLLDLGRYEVAGQAARREATRLDAIVGERQSLVESNYQDATASRLRELEAISREARKHHAELERAKSEARAIAARAAEAERAGILLSESVGELAKASAELERLASRWPELENEQRVTQDRLKATEQALVEARRRLENERKSLERTVEQTGDAAALARAEAAATAHGRERVELARLDRELAAARREAEKRARAVEAARKKATAAKSAVGKATRLRERAETAKGKAEALERCATASVTLARLDDELARAHVEATAARDALDEARKRLRHLEQKHAAAFLRGELAPGDRCPVCDAVVGVLPEPEADPDADLDAATRAAAKAEEHEQATRAIVVAVETRRKAAAEALEHARKLLPKAERLPTADEAAASLAEASEALTSAVRAEADARAAFEAAANAVAKADVAASTAQTKADGIAQNRNGAEKRLQAALAELTTIFGPKLPADVSAEATRRREILERAEASHRTAVEAANGAMAEREDAQRAHAECAESVGSFDHEFVAARTAARMACESVVGLVADADLPAPPGDAPRASLLAEWPRCCDEYVSAGRQAIRRLEEEIKTSAHKLAQLAAHTGIELDATGLTAVLSQFDVAATRAHGAVVAADKDAAALSRRIGEREKLEQQIADDRKLCARYDELARELRTDHFIAFVLEESLTRLAAQASDELLAISDRRYSLVADEGSFEVVDHHNADERRSVATLSGGEMFLASLSLALALSASLRELAGTAAGRLEAIFIDEGFGALDPETLDVVVETLERLRESDRMIGVITHVRSLADRIPDGLAVQKNGSSSRILFR
jgi:DNA repair protein SbcC/Rad50